MTIDYAHSRHCPTAGSNWSALWRALGTAAAACLAFGLLAYVSIDLARNSGRIAAVWVPNALAIAFLLRARISREELFLAGAWLGNALANLMHGDTLTTALLFSLANSVEVLLVVHLTRKWCGLRPDMQRLDHLARFAGGAAIAGCFASASISQIAVTLQFGPDPAKFFTWMLSDGLALLILTPASLILADAVVSLQMPNRSKILKWSILSAVGTLITIVVFYQTDLPLLFLIPPVVIAFAFWLGSLGTAVATLEIAMIAVIFTASGHGPIALSDISSQGKMLILQAFLAASFLIGLPVSAVLNGNRKMVKELADQKRQLSLLTNNITDAVLRLDHKGICTYGSPSVEKVLGRPLSDFIGRPVTERVHPDAARTLRAIEEKLLKGEAESERVTYRRLLDDEHGKPVYIEADCAVARNPDTGEDAGIIFCARNVTQRVMLERQLSKARANAEDAARAKSRFLANMSHEIRTPMNGVLGFAELLRQSDLPPTEAQYAEIIVESGHSMMTILNDILDLSKIEAGQLKIIKQPVDIVRVVEECCELYRDRIRSKGLELVVDVDPHMPAAINSDPQRLRQILLNLIGNAAKFTACGSIEVGVSSARGQCEITVRDSGIGIEPQRLEGIFEPFTQAEEATDRSYGGTGLGLAISRQLAEILGGTLSVSSAIGSGSRFTIGLPLDLVEGDAESAAKAAEDIRPRLPDTARILLAEDHEVNRMLVTAMMDRCGLRVEIAHDGEEAIEKVLAADRSKAPFDLVLMDIQMPRCDGYEATRAIRMAGIGPDTLPILALTANAFADDVTASRIAGMQAHIAKPLVFEELVKALNRWLPHSIIGNEEERPGQSGQNGNERAITQNMAATSEWRARRADALDDLESALTQDGFTGEQAQALARTLHKVAGTAGLFGEAELGERAAQLERALRDGVAQQVCRQLAQGVLTLAEKS